MKMSVHQALAELKTLSKRINSASKEVFVSSATVNSDKVAGINREDAITKMKANLQSVKQLIENRKLIRAAVVASNASTKVTIAGKEYTVAEAIERKSLIEDETTLLKYMQAEYSQALASVNSANEVLKDKAERYVQALTSADKTNRTPDEIKELTEDYIKRNTQELVDPNGLKGEIDALSKSIDDFLTEVDYKLSESNATTMIEVAID